MIFLFPLLIIVFICLLIAKLAGAAVTWGLVFLPLAIVCILMLLFSFIGNITGKKKMPTKSDHVAQKNTEEAQTQQTQESGSVEPEASKAQNAQDNKPE